MPHSRSSQSQTSAWFIHAFESGAAITPADFIRLRGLAPDFYTALFHSAAAAEIAVSENNDAAARGQEAATHSSAQWSILLLAPDASAQIDLVAAPNLEIKTEAPSAAADKPFLNRLDAAQKAPVAPPRCPLSGQILPFASGWQLYLGYELAAEVEPVLAPALATYAQGVVAQARRVRGALLFNHLSQQVWCCLESAYAPSFERIQADLQSTVLADIAVNEAALIQAVVEDEPQQFRHGVEKTLEYIRDGDVFQVNLSRAWQLTVAPEVSSESLYRQLVSTNPAPFSAWLSIAAAKGVAAESAGFELISSSPERLVAIDADIQTGQQRWINTRPIAGTRPRLAGRDKDRQYLQELRQSPKENAEHLMLIDLERNDLGRVCVPGSIEVNELMSIESFAHVHHIVSNVRGKKRDDVSVGQVIAAVFPGGTITGCPKVRCMQIIAELEQTQRSAYTGAVGYLGLDGQLDLNIVIRSLQRQQDSPQHLSLRAGAGIVADSEVEHELKETRAKANSVLRAFARALPAEGG